MKFKECCTVSEPDFVSEGYQIIHGGILANVSDEKHRAILDAFRKMHPGMKYFCLELPLRVESSGGSQEMMEVYYLDSCTEDKLQRILELLAPWLEKDGMIQYSVGCHDYQDEIMFCIFNVVVFISQNAVRYTQLLEQNQVPKVGAFYPATRFFSAGMLTGHTELYYHNGNDIRTMLPELKSMGLYLAEVRPLRTF